MIVKNPVESILTLAASVFDAFERGVHRALQTLQVKKLRIGIPVVFLGTDAPEHKGIVDSALPHECGHGGRSHVEHGCAFAVHFSLRHPALHRGKNY